MKKVVHILGSTRSGTTMLDLMISSHTGCFSVGELCLLHKRTCGFCGDACEFWKQYRAVKGSDEFYRAAFEISGADILVDSSKKWKWLKDRAKHEEYDYKVLHLVRNGKDRLRFRKRQDGRITSRVVQAWVNTHRRCEEVRSKFGGLLVRYEDIHKGLPEICEFIGVEYCPEALEFWKYEHHGLLGSKTAYSLVKEAHGKRGEYQDYVKAQGFSFRPRTGHEFLDDKDLAVFKKHGGEKLNRKLGYE